MDCPDRNHQTKPINSCMVQASIACAVKHALRSPEHNAQETSISTNTVMMIPAASLDHIIHRSRVYALDIGQCILI